MPQPFPRTVFNILRAQAVLESVEHRVLIIGQKQAAGTASAGALVESFGSDDAVIASQFGARSAVAQMIRAFRAINQESALDILPLADNAGATPATAGIGFTGTASENGRIFVEVTSGAQRRYTVDVVSGDTASAVAARLEALLDADTNAPFTAAVTDGDVTVTAANGGTLANDWHLLVDGAVSGLTVSLTAWSGGATDPTLTNLFAPIQGRRYQTVVWPSALDALTLETELNSRFNSSDGLLQGVGILTEVDTAANIQTLANSLNSESMVVIASQARNTPTLTGNAHREMPDVISARVAALRSLRLSNDASLTEFLTTPAAADQFGGRGLASLPYANTVLPNTAIVRPVDDWTPLQYSTFLDNGVAVITQSRTLSTMLLGEIVTTNTTDPAGNQNTSFKFLNTVDTVAAIRDAFDLNFRARYGQSRLTDGDLVPGRDMANQQSIEAFCEEIYQTLAEDALVQAGQAALRDFKANGRVVAVDVAAGQVNVDIAPLLVNGLRVILGTVTVNFGS